MTKYEYKIELNEQQVERLRRLHVSNELAKALDEYLQDLINVKVGTALISSPSQYSSAISAPSPTANYI